MCLAPWTSHSGSELIRVWLLQVAMTGWDLDLHERKGLYTGHMPSVKLQSIPITLLMASLSHLRCGTNLLISRALNTPSAFPIKHSALLFLIPSQVPNLYLGFILFMGYVEICFANTFSKNGTNSCDGFLPCSLSNWRSPVATLCGTKTRCCLRVPPSTARLASLL